MEEKQMPEYWDIPCNFGTTVDEFEHYVGRKPKDKKEMEDWTHLLKKGMDAQLNWDIIYKCAAENFNKKGT